MQTKLSKIAAVNAFCGNQIIAPHACGKPYRVGGPCPYLNAMVWYLFTLDNLLCIIDNRDVNILNTVFCGFNIAHTQWTQSRKDCRCVGRHDWDGSISICLERQARAQLISETKNDMSASPPLNTVGAPLQAICVEKAKEYTVQTRVDCAPTRGSHIVLFNDDPNRKLAILPPIHPYEACEVCQKNCVFWHCSKTYASSLQFFNSQLLEIAEFFGTATHTNITYYFGTPRANNPYLARFRRYSPKSQ